MSDIPLSVVGFLIIWGLLFFSPVWIFIFRRASKALHDSGIYIKPLGEYGQMATLVAITLILGIASIDVISNFLPALTEGDLVWDSYDVTLYDNGTMSERIVTDVSTSGEYQMLYRYWDDSLYYKGQATSGTYPCIEFASSSVPPDTTGYMVDANHVVFTVGGLQYADYIGSKAYSNELGAYNPSYYDEGMYPMEFDYVLHPPVQYDDRNAHLNLKFFREHPAIRHMNITIYSSHSAKP
jgi:uncharacterized membrane protein